MDRDRVSRHSASSNRHNNRADLSSSSSKPPATASASSAHSSSVPYSGSSSSAANVSSKAQAGPSTSSTTSKRSTNSTGRRPRQSTAGDQEDESIPAAPSSSSESKGKGKEVPSAQGYRRSTRNVSQPSHSPTLVSKAAKEAAASSSSSRSSKRNALDLDTSQDLHSSKRSKPNLPASRRNSTVSSTATATPRMTRNSVPSAASSAASSTQSHGKSKGKSRSSRSSRHSNQGHGLVTATSSSSASNMDLQCGLNHEDPSDESHVEVKPEVAEPEHGQESNERASSATEPETGSTAGNKAPQTKAEAVAKDDDDDEGPDAEAMHDDDREDEEEEDGESNFEDEQEDEYDEGNPDGGDDGAFGMNIRAMAGYMTGLTGRFRTLLTSLRGRDDPQTQLAALQELSDLLIVSTEDSLAGYFPIDSFVKELIYIMGGPKPVDHGASSTSRTVGGGAAGGSSMSLHDADSSVGSDLGVSVKKEDDEDAAMAAAIAAAAGFEDNGEVMLIACRCLANLMEAMPYAAHSVVTCGAIPVLCSKLIEITFIDLAEQVLQTLEKISVDYPSAIVKEGGLNAMLQFLDFFNIHVQRTAMITAANCCRKLTADSFTMVSDIMPIVQNVLGYADQRLVESACKCVVRMIDSYRHHPELLEKLITSELVGPLCELLLAASGGSGAATASVKIGSNTHTELLKALGTASKASPEAAVTLLDKNIVETLYQLLTGSTPPQDITAQSLQAEGSSSAQSVQAEGSSSAPAVSIEDISNDTAVSAAVAVVPEGASVAVADMAVLQNLAQRPKEQIQDALSLIAELLPPLPRDGIFDARAYTEKVHRKLLQKQKDKERDIRRAARAGRRRAPSASVSSAPGGKDKATKVDVDGDTEMNELLATDGSSEATTSAVSMPAVQDSSSAADPAAVASTSSAGPSSAAQKAERTKSEREVAKEAANTRRIDKLKEHEGPVRRFSQLMLPTLVEVYAASVTLHVRTKALNAILKITSFMDAEDLRAIFKDVPVANFVADILSSREHATLVQSALQMVELLHVKLPDVYQMVLRREGVMYEVDDIAAREPAGKGKAPEKTPEKSNTVVKSEPVPLALPSRASAATSQAAASDRVVSSTTLGTREALPVYEYGVAGRSTFNSMATQAAAEAEDANIWRARILRDRFTADTTAGDGGKRAGQALDEIRELVAGLSDKEATDVEAMAATVTKVAELFGKQDEPISSFELLKSGLIESLYVFSTSTDLAVDLQERRKMLIQAFMPASSSGTSPASHLVRRLQESLSRLENVEITTAISTGGDETRRSPTSILAKQLRLRLVAEDSSEVPRSCHQVVVTIHAIASFQSLNDYLRPKIAASAGAGSTSSASGIGGSSSSGDTNSRLSNILAALSAAGNGLDSGSGLSAASALRQSLAALSSSVAASAAAAAAATSSAALSGAPRVTAASESRSSGAAASGTSEAEKAVRRRSSRLETNAAETSAAADSSTASNREENAETEAISSAAAASSGDSSVPAGPESDEALARRLVEGLLQEGYDEDMFTDEEYEEEVLEDDLPAEASQDQAEKAVALKVASNGNVVAETSTATEPAADTGEASTSSAAAQESSGSGPSRTARGSYSAALQRKTSDWHLEFFMDGKPINLQSTIYGAVHNFEATRTSSSSLSNRYIWQNIYTVTYKKTSGPVPTEEANGTPEPEQLNSAAIVLPESIPKDAPYANILQLLGVMHDLNTMWREKGDYHAVLDGRASALAENAFINNKLTAKLNRQLEEPMIVASSCLPGWCMDLPRAFPFLFPFETRYSYLQSTSFGYARLLTKWQSLHSRTQDAGSRRDDSFGFLSRLQRQKVRISRSRLFESAMKVFELYGHNTSVLEVEYFEEVGTGLGPTLEFYALVSREFARRDLGIWRDDGHGASGPKFVTPTGGLFPAPQSASDMETEEGKHRLAVFKTLGQFVAKALLDSRIIDCNFSPVFMKAVLNANIPVTIASLRTVDPALARSMDQLLEMDAEMLASMSLDFTLPGHPGVELVEDGKQKAVDLENVQEYVDAIISQTMWDGIQPQVRAFRRGFNLIMPLQALSSFTPDELVMLFGNMDEDWSETTLLASIKPDHGFNSESASFRDLVAIMANFDVTKRREFLQWLTGSPKLPIGGFAGLHPQLTIVKRPHEAPLAPDDYLPSVMTCVNYLKMPGYSSREKMRGRLETAMSEGSGSFYLS